MWNQFLGIYTLKICYDLHALNLQINKIQSPKNGKNNNLEFIDSSKLISCKIGMTEKSWNLHTVTEIWKRNIYQFTMEVIKVVAPWPILTALWWCVRVRSWILFGQILTSVIAPYEIYSAHSARHAWNLSLCLSSFFGSFGSS